MKLFDFENYDAKDVPSGEVFINDDGVNLDQYIEDRNVVVVGIILPFPRW